MKYIELKGAKIPALGFGTWPLNGAECVRAVRTALECGYRHIDTAQMYGNEAEVGRAIQESGVPRGELWVTTKLANGNLATKDVASSAAESLRKLGLEQVDLLLIHWPSKNVPMAETLAAMQKLREAGKTRFIGVSNFTVTLLAEAVERHRADLLCDQVEYHPFLSQRPVLEAVCKYGMMLTAYAPVARGRVGNEPVLRRIAETYGKTPAQVALKWLIDQDRVAAVPKAASRAHAEANIDIFDFELTPLDRAAIDALAGSDRLVDIGGWAPEWDEA